MEDLQPLAAARTRSVSGLDRPIRRRGPQGDAMRRLRATHPIPSARSLLNSGGTRLGAWPARREATPHRASLSQRYFEREPMPAFDAAGLRCGRGVKRMVLPSQGRNCAVDCQPPPAASRWPRTVCCVTARSPRVEDSDSASPAGTISPALVRQAGSLASGRSGRAGRGCVPRPGRPAGKLRCGVDLGCRKDRHRASACRADARSRRCDHLNGMAALAPAQGGNERRPALPHGLARFNGLVEHGSVSLWLLVTAPSRSPARA
jgi:hypothetical protein